MNHSYHHQPPAPQQEPDTQPGAYYVSAVDGPKLFLLLGPFDKHAHALAAVDQVRSFANDRAPESCFFAFGTVRYPEGTTKEGSANKFLPYLLPKMGVMPDKA